MMDRKDRRLYDRYLVYYQEDLMVSLKKLKDANTQVNLLTARVGHTKKYNFWLACVKMFINRVRVCLDWYEKWVHPDDVRTQLRTYLTLMTKYQTTTAAHWIQLQVKKQLEEVMGRMFWSH